MPTVTLSGRSDLFPVGTTVGIYPGNAQRPNAPGPPTAPAIATGVVDAAGNLSVTNAGILQGVRYVAYAQVGGIDTFIQARSTLDVSDTGKATGTATTTNASAALSSVSASVGAFAIGQRITGPGIPAGAYLVSGSGANWTMSDKATASATVAVSADGGSPAQVPADKGSGALAVPGAVTTWRAKVMQRRAIIGTS